VDLLRGEPLEMLGGGVTIPKKKFLQRKIVPKKISVSALTYHLKKFLQANKTVGTCYLEAKCIERQLQAGILFRW